MLQEAAVFLDLGRIWYWITIRLFAVRWHPSDFSRDRLPCLGHYFSESCLKGEVLHEDHCGAGATSH